MQCKVCPNRRINTHRHSNTGLTSGQRAMQAVMTEENNSMVTKRLGGQLQLELLMSASTLSATMCASMSASATELKYPMELLA